MESIGFSLWLMPDGETHDQLVSLIAELARRRGTPTFAPHLTLLGGLSAAESDVIALSAQLAESAPALRLECLELQHSEAYYKSVFVRLSPSPELLRLRTKALEGVGLAAGPYEPHLSLVYGDLDPEEREDLVAAARGRFPPDIEVCRLDVYSTAGTPDRWRRVARLPLAGH